MVMAVQRRTVQFEKITANNRLIKTIAYEVKKAGRKTALWRGYVVFLRSSEASWDRPILKITLSTVNYRTDGNYQNRVNER